MPPSLPSFPYFSRVLTVILSATRTWRVVLGVLMVVVCYLALTPQPPPNFTTGWDKMNHGLAFTALAFSGFLSQPKSRAKRVAMLLGVFALGGLIEILQLYVPGRSGEWGDLLADGVGILWGAALAAGLVGMSSAP